MQIFMVEKHLAKTRKFKVEDINQILEIEKQAFPKTVFSKATLLDYANQTNNGTMPMLPEKSNCCG